MKLDILLWSIMARNGPRQKWAIALGRGTLDNSHIKQGRRGCRIFYFSGLPPHFWWMAGDMSETHPRTLSARNGHKKPDIPNGPPMDCRL